MSSVARWVAGWRACLRLARRDALKHPGRSVLIVIMIALPVIGVAASDVVVRSHQLTAAERADRDMGSVADAFVQYVGVSRIVQSPDGSQWQPVSDAALPPTTDSLTVLQSVLPAESRVLPERSGWVMLQAASGSRAPTVTADLTLADASSSVVAGRYPIVAGRAAEAPDEIELSVGLARRVGVGVGQQVVTFRPQQVLTVVGIVGSRWQGGDRTAIAPIGGVLSAAAGGSGSDVGGGTSYLVKTPRPVQWSDVLRLNALGFVVKSRAVYLHPPSDTGVSFPGGGGTAVMDTALTAAIVAGGMGLLEVVLLAGPAFAVGARRQRRQLGVLAAVGGDRIDLRRTVLAQGVVLGIAGGVVGAGVGVGLGVLGRQLLIDHAAEVFGGMHWHPVELAATALVGVVTGLLAAMLPARSASRQDVVAALSGRRGAVRSSRLLPVAGVLAFSAGVGVAALGAVEARRATFILAGSMVAELGLVMCTPILVGAAGRLSPLFRGSLRLALRDAARNRGRSAPAAAAILAAAAGCIGVLVYSAGTQAHDRVTYVPRAPRGAVTVAIPWPDEGLGTSQSQIQAVTAALYGSLPVRDLAVVETGAASCKTGGSTCIEVRPAQPPRCERRGGCSFGGNFPEPVVGGPGIVSLLVGHDEPRAEQMLHEGGVVVFDPSEVVDGKTALIVTAVHPNRHPTRSDTSPSEPSSVTLPAVAVRPGDNATPILVLSPQAAQQIGLTVEPAGVVASTSKMPSSRAEDLARTAVQRAGAVALDVERGYRDPNAGLTFVLIGFAALVIVGASGIATGLAIADGRADHATLAAVGAPPGVRRRLAAAQSAVLGLLGAVAGAVAGIIPAAAVLHSHSIGRDLGYPLVLPWPSLLAVVFGVPMLAAAFAWLCTRSHLPLGRRTT